MDPATIMAAVGLATQIGSALFGSDSASESAKAQSQAQARAYAAQIEAEGVRKQAMEFDSMRRKREEVRKAVAARSMALASGTFKGGVQGSALDGDYGGISGRSNVNVMGIEGNRQFGSKIFDLNMQASAAQRDAAIAGAQGQQDTSFWSGMSSIGGSVANNSDKIGKIGTYLFS